VGELRPPSHLGIIVHNPVVFEPGSIKNTFENGEEFSFDTSISKEKIEVLKSSVAEDVGITHPGIDSASRDLKPSLESLCSKRFRGNKTHVLGMIVGCFYGLWSIGINNKAVL
jgi:hypothetical protein